MNMLSVSIVKHQIYWTSSLFFGIYSERLQSPTLQEQQQYICKAVCSCGTLGFVIEEEEIDLPETPAERVWGFVLRCSKNVI